MTDFALEPLQAEEIPSAVRLSTQAGWNQTPQDWQRLVDLEPEGVQVWRDAGEIRASFSVVGYEKQGSWIGMILVDKAYRRRGLGSLVFQSALAYARKTHGETVGLDATPEGEALYRKFGFESAAVIERWQGSLRFDPEAPAAPALGKSEAAELFALDQVLSGVNRRPLLQHLLASPEVKAWGFRRAGRLTAFGFLRPGRNASHLGPLVGEIFSDLRPLFQAAAGALEGQPVMGDAVRQSELSEFLAAAGWQVSRPLARMTYPRARLFLSLPTSFLATGFELG